MMAKSMMSVSDSECFIDAGEGGHIGEHSF